MRTAESLLAQATAVLGSAGPHSNRAACWIARAALEAAVDDLLSRKQRPTGDASMRSKLSVLQVAYAQDGDLPARAGYAWARLSQLCHHHAFELTPSATEAGHLLDLVATLVRTSGDSALRSPV